MSIEKAFMTQAAAKKPEGVLQQLRNRGKSLGVRDQLQIQQVAIDSSDVDDFEQSPTITITKEQPTIARVFAL